MVQSPAGGERVEKLYSAEEVAEYLKVTLRTVRDWIKKGEIRASKVGKAYLVKESDIQRFVNDRMLKPDAEE